MRYALKDAQGNILRYENFVEKPNDPVGKGWIWEEAPYTPEPPPIRTISKGTILTRLYEAGQFTAFMQRLGGTKTYKYETWSITPEVSVDDATLLEDLAAIGADVDVILAE